MNEQEGTHLDAAEALKLAARLTLLPKFSPHPEALPALADYLSSMIQGQNWGCRWWTAQEQAEWLIEKILSTWQFWRGPAPMRELYTSRFCVSDVLREDAHQAKVAAAEVPVALCGACNDAGCVQRDGRFEWCECRQGQLLAEETPEFLVLLNRSQKPTSPRRADRCPIPIDPGLRERMCRGIEQAEAERRKAKQNEGERNPTKEAQQ